MNEQERRIDYIKHLNTLSTGAIVHVATFLEKAFQHAVEKHLAILSILGFLLSVISAVAAYTLEVVFQPASLERSALRMLDGLVTVGMWAGFLDGDHDLRMVRNCECTMK